MGIALVVIPLAFNFGAGAQTWLPVLLGGGVILYSLLTDYELGAVDLIGMPAHLILDALGACCWPPRPGSSGSPGRCGSRTSCWAWPRSARRCSPRRGHHIGRSRRVARGSRLEARPVPTRPGAMRRDP